VIKNKIAIMLNDKSIFRWQKNIINSIMLSQNNTIVGFIVNSSARKDSAKVGVIPRLVYRFDKLRHKKTGLFDKVDISECFDFATISVSPITESYYHSFSEVDIDNIKNLDADLCIKFGFKILKSDILNAFKLGIWSLHAGDSNRYRGSAPCIWEVLNREKITGSILQKINPTLDGGVILYKSFGKTDRVRIIRNKEKTYQKIQYFPIRVLDRLSLLGHEEFSKRMECDDCLPAYSYQLYKNLSSYDLLINYSRHLINVAKDKIKNESGKWIIRYKISNNKDNNYYCFAPYQFKDVIPPSDRFWADPFVIYEKDTYYVFIEEFIYKERIGFLSCFEIDKNGDYTNPKTILKKECHLSYPNVFKYNNEYYMTPETKENEKIALYKCVKFPYEWEFYKDLICGINAVDPTLLFHDEKWWMFTNVSIDGVIPTTDELFIYYSDDLLTGEFHQHPLNPVISDVRVARSAGKIFNYKGTLYRPSQDNSVRYGYGLNFNKIIKLTTTDYQEELSSSIHPKWSKKSKGIHTFNHDNKMTVIDEFRSL
jgi:hypothetical protein